MKYLLGSVVLAAVVGLPLMATAALTDKYVKVPTAQKQQEQHAGALRHTHRHCHVVVTLGHAKKRCHTHRHNKVVHHGPRYH